MQSPISNGMKPKNKIASFFDNLFVNFHHLSFVSKIERVIEKMNLSEKIIFGLFSFILIISALTLLNRLHQSFLVEVPAFGGSFTEGLAGSPRFINPVLAVSDTDKDVSSLIYSGLLKSKEAGGFENDLASSYEIQEDGTVYDFVIKDNAYFHDGTAVTSDDVVFTINKILDPVIKSPKKSNFEGITVEKISEKEVKFILKKPYAPFLNALTLGILPKHIWENVSPEEFPFSQFNISPIGSGPYKIEKITRNSGGIPTIINLSAWDRYVLGKTKIKSINLKFFQNEGSLVKAYDEKSIDSAAGLSPNSAKRLIANKSVVKETSLPRVFGVFFNQNIAPVLLNKEIREALEISAPKKRIVDDVLLGFGKILNGPTPANTEEDSQKTDGDIEAAKALLLKNGWKVNDEGILEKKTKTGTSTFQFSISTSDAPELKKTAEILQETWNKLGASVSIKVFEAGDLSQNIIKGRKYDALLFGEVVGVESDLYPFWHSSERNDPGLNISLYANITTDKILETMQKETDELKKLEEKEILLAEIKKDMPAIFLFSPSFLYAPAPQVKNILLKNISSQNERFVSIEKWFIETDKVWKFLSN
ncbi:MAG: ABC transporter substrate-binding protein [Candidatus Paceibacterota bacterium]|jgi:peptide/nickel transport system substrate-binding protein